MVEEKDVYEYVTNISNLADELEHVMGANVMDKNFMATVYFSIMEMSRYLNIVEIIMIGPILQKGDLINKLRATEHQHKVANKRPLKLHNAI